MASRMTPGVLALFVAVALAQAAHAREYMRSDFSGQRGFSDAVVTEGGRIVWLAGQVAVQDEEGKSLAGDLQGQARAIFRSMDRQLRKAGGSLQNLTTITVFLTDPRYLEPLAPVRKEFFPDGNFPASTTVTVSSLAAPAMLIEIQGTAVVGDR